MNARLRTIYEAAQRLYPSLLAVFRLWMSVRSGGNAGSPAAAGDRTQPAVGVVSDLPVLKPSILDPLKLWWLQATDQWHDRAPVGATRSPEWPAVQRAHLEQFPTCACCGGKDNLRVHHKEPFHLNPDRELDPDNLVTLCESKKYGINCHLLLGHLGNWQRWNPLVIVDVYRWKAKLDPDLIGISADQLETFAEACESAAIEHYIRNLRWSSETNDDIRTYVAGNIRGFYQWLKGDRAC